MIVKLKFDMFYTIIEVPNISIDELKKDIYDKSFERWRHRNGLLFDDNTVIKWLCEKTFHNNEVKILEKHLELEQSSNYKDVITLYF